MKRQTRPELIPGLAILALIAALPLAILAAQATDSTTTIDLPGTHGTSKSLSPEAAKGAAPVGGRIDGYLAAGRWREGSKLVDMAGEFKVTGDRVTFFSSDGKIKFVCLENLSGERVARIVSESPEALHWLVNGTITEYRNENYLLITQAVIRTRPAPKPGSR